MLSLTTFARVALLSFAFALQSHVGAAVAAPGDLDASFANGGIAQTSIGGFADHRAGSLQALPDGKTIVAGTCLRTQPEGAQGYGVCVVRYRVDGSLDPAFGDNGQAFYRVDVNLRAVGLTVRPDGKLLVVATAEGILVLRFSANGQLDPTFGDGGTLTTDILPDVPGQAAAVLGMSGGFVLAARCTIASVSRYCVARFDDDGQRVAAFGVPAIVAYDSNLPAPHLLATANGKIALAATCWLDGRPLGCVAQFRANGTLDSAFGINGVALVMRVTNGIFVSSAAASTADGRIVFAGQCIDNSNEMCATRISVSGQVDASFGVAGFVAFPSVQGSYAHTGAIAVQPDQKLLFAGLCRSAPTNIDDVNCVVRLQPDGAPDATFGQAGVSLVNLTTEQNVFETPAAASLDPTGRLILVAECFTNDAGVYVRFCGARLQGDPTAVASCSLNIDNNNRVAPATDGVLVARYLFGLRGSALTDGATDINPGRTPAEIEAELAAQHTQGKLDADGDGQSLAMTDGLLILRAMLGLTGDALTAGAVNTAHPNVRNAQQVLSWIESTHGVACLP